MAKFLVIHTDPDLHPLSEPLKSSLGEAGAEVMLIRSGPQEFSQYAGRADAVLNADFKLTASLIGLLNRCRVISRFGTGVDNIDVDAATARGIPVANVPEFCTEEVANRAWTLLLSCACQLRLQDQSVRDGRWRSSEIPLTPPLGGATLGLIGFGKIARAVARRARPFGMRVQAFDPFLERAAFESEGVAAVSMETLLQTSDYISLHLPQTPETYHFMGTSALSKVKSTAIIINTARGGLIDEAALIAMLREGRLTGAGLDVLEKEPPSPDNPLLRNDRVILTPHSAAFTNEALENVRRSAVEAVIRVLGGRRPLHVVNAGAVQK